MINLKSPQQTLFRPRYTHACQEKLNPSRDPVLLSRKIIGKDKRIMNNFKKPVLIHFCTTRKDAGCYTQKNRLRESKGL